MNAVRTRPRPGARAALNLGQQRWLLEGVRKAALRAGHSASVRHLDAALLAVQAAEALSQPAEPPPTSTGALVHTIWVVLSAIAEQEAGNAVGRTALNLRLRAFPSGLEAHLCAPPFLRLQLDARLVARLRAVRHDPVVEAHELGELADELARQREEGMRANAATGPTAEERQEAEDDAEIATLQALARVASHFDLAVPEQRRLAETVLAPWSTMVEGAQRASFTRWAGPVSA